MSGPPLFVSWSVRHGRSRDLAAALGADAVYVGVRQRRRRWLSPARYVVCALLTAKLLVTRRPRAIVVMAPPLPLTVLALAYGRVARVPVGLDAHTGAVLAMRSGQPRRSLQFLARLATVTIVTNSQLAEPLRARRVTTVVLHDPPVTVPAASIDAAMEEPFTVVAPLSWAPDEPVDQIVQAAALCADVRFVATGNPPAAMRDRRDLPPNLDLAGFLGDAAFDSLMATAGVVLALTTRDATMQRAGYEAMAVGCPAIASDTAVLREFFADAALYARNGRELADRVRDVQAGREDLAARMRRRRVEVGGAFEDGVRDVVRLLGLTAPER